jgi:hypothetical protein
MKQIIAMKGIDDVQNGQTVPLIRMIFDISLEKTVTDLFIKSDISYTIVSLNKNKISIDVLEDLAIIIFLELVECGFKLDILENLLLFQRDVINYYIETHNGIVINIIL